MTGIKKTIGGLPVVGKLASKIRSYVQGKFPGSKTYWEQRYAQGENSGCGSRGRLAEFKAQVLNAFVKENGIKSVIELGCGDGFQISLASYPRYIGLDVSATAIKLCKEQFANDATKSFFLYDPSSFMEKADKYMADLSLSLDVIFHLTEDQVFEEYMRHLFSVSNKYTIIYSSNYDTKQTFHIKQREFSKWVDTHQPEWRLVKKIDNPFKFDSNDPENTSHSDFFIYQKLAK